ncbi:hypothetical protein VOLCADRAFT_98738 [Volvox carteri f. nagariensis]|uniref:Uncharacterized protein n=1 Tax=Volvox carteri f. nagariensis TaxID=3068 RepID=D8UG59_VOLCA|nr:uncharacterized protein VOLCADRAFT_98738 [Volvox carteri f. nagariensis]EFJ41319.1 hypothetical protein VOLCADRAFT_98738 [Volvox carteri f. nagariensis]|eukprot:XP_002957653.1 hypothetical protein VOLCADRAFT_98738 [Volvox carteri f. nagariensis]
MPAYSFLLAAAAIAILAFYWQKYVRSKPCSLVYPHAEQHAHQVPASQLCSLSRSVTEPLDDIASNVDAFDLPQLAGILGTLVEEGFQPRRTPSDAPAHADELLPSVADDIADVESAPTALGAACLQASWLLVQLASGPPETRKALSRGIRAERVAAFMRAILPVDLRDNPAPGSRAACSAFACKSARSSELRSSSSSQGTPDSSCTQQHQHQEHQHPLLTQQQQQQQHGHCVTIPRRQLPESLIDAVLRNCSWCLLLLFDAGWALPACAQSQPSVGNAASYTGPAGASVDLEAMELAVLSGHALLQQGLWASEAVALQGAECSCRESPPAEVLVRLVQGWEGLEASVTAAAVLACLALLEDADAQLAQGASQLLLASPTFGYMCEVLCRARGVATASASESAVVDTWAGVDTGLSGTFGVRAAAVPAAAALPRKPAARACEVISQFLLHTLSQPHSAGLLLQQAVADHAVNWLLHAAALPLALRRQLVKKSPTHGMAKSPAAVPSGLGRKGHSLGCRRRTWRTVTSGGFLLAPAPHRADSERPSANTVPAAGMGGVNPHLHEQGQAHDQRRILGGGADAAWEPDAALLGAQALGGLQDLEDEYFMDAHEYDPWVGEDAAAGHGAADIIPEPAAVIGAPDGELLVDGRASPARAGPSLAAGMDRPVSTLAVACRLLLACGRLDSAFGAFFSDLRTAGRAALKRRCRLGGKPGGYARRGSLDGRLRELASAAAVHQAMVAALWSANGSSSGGAGFCGGGSGGGSLSLLTPSGSSGLSRASAAAWWPPSSMRNSGAAAVPEGSSPAAPYPYDRSGACLSSGTEAFADSGCADPVGIFSNTQQQQQLAQLQLPAGALTDVMAGVAGLIDAMLWRSPSLGCGRCLRGGLTDTYDSMSESNTAESHLSQERGSMDTGMAQGGPAAAPALHNIQLGQWRSAAAQPWQEGRRCSIPGALQKWEESAGCRTEAADPWTAGARWGGGAAGSAAAVGGSGVPCHVASLSDWQGGAEISGQVTERWGSESRLSGQGELPQHPGPPQDHQYQAGNSAGTVMGIGSRHGGPQYRRSSSGGGGGDPLGLYADDGGSVSDAEAEEQQRQSQEEVWRAFEEESEDADAQSGLALGRGAVATWLSLSSPRHMVQQWLRTESMPGATITHLGATGSGCCKPSACCPSCAARRASHSAGRTDGAGAECCCPSSSCQVPLMSLSDEILGQVATVAAAATATDADAAAAAVEPLKAGDRWSRIETGVAVGNPNADVSASSLRIPEMSFSSCQRVSDDRQSAREENKSADGASCSFPGTVPRQCSRDGADGAATRTSVAAMEQLVLPDRERTSAGSSVASRLPPYTYFGSPQLTAAALAVPVDVATMVTASLATAGRSSNSAASRIAIAAAAAAAAAAASNVGAAGTTTAAATLAASAARAKAAATTNTNRPVDASAGSEGRWLGPMLGAFEAAEEVELESDTQLAVDNGAGKGNGSGADSSGDFGVSSFRCCRDGGVGGHAKPNAPVPLTVLELPYPDARGVRLLLADRAAVAPFAFDTTDGGAEVVAAARSPWVTPQASEAEVLWCSTSGRAEWYGGTADMHTPYNAGGWARSAGKAPDAGPVKLVSTAAAAATAAEALASIKTSARCPPGPWCADDWRRAMGPVGTGTAATPVDAAAGAAEDKVAVFAFGSELVGVSSRGFRALRRCSPLLHGWLSRAPDHTRPITLLRVPGLDDSANRRPDEEEEGEEGPPGDPEPQVHASGREPSLRSTEEVHSGEEPLEQLWQLWRAADYLQVDDLLTAVEDELARRFTLPHPHGTAAWNAALSLAGAQQHFMGSASRLAHLCALHFMRRVWGVLGDEELLLAAGAGAGVLSPAVAAEVRDRLVALVALADLDLFGRSCCFGCRWCRNSFPVSVHDEAGTALVGKYKEETGRELQWDRCRSGIVRRVNGAGQVPIGGGGHHCRWDMGARGTGRSGVWGVVPHVLLTAYVIAYVGHHSELHSGCGWNNKMPVELLGSRLCLDAGLRSILSSCTSIRTAQHVVDVMLAPPKMRTSHLAAFAAIPVAFQ